MPNKPTSTPPPEKTDSPAKSALSDHLTDTLSQVANKISSTSNILVALSKDPSVDEMTAALGLTLALDRIGKHATAIYSGATPNALEFLEPERTFEKDINSLQDFIIALSKEKADHLRYVVEGDYVHIYITPYRTTISESDLSFSRGDFNVDLVIAFDVQNGEDLDGALSEYGRIMHDATAINITTGEPGRFAELEWTDPSASSVSELVLRLLDRLQVENIDPDIATALLTGIVSATERFSNERTNPDTMAIAARLMTAGADQQLIASHIVQNEVVKPTSPATSPSTTTPPPVPATSPSSVTPSTLTPPSSPATTTSSNAEPPAQASDNFLTPPPPLPPTPLDPALSAPLQTQPLSAPQTPQASPIAPAPQTSPTVPAPPQTSPIAPTPPSSPVVEVPSSNLTPEQQLEQIIQSPASSSTSSPSIFADLTETKAEDTPPSPVVMTSSFSDSASLQPLTPPATEPVDYSKMMADELTNFPAPNPTPIVSPPIENPVIAATPLLAPADPSIPPAPNLPLPNEQTFAPPPLPPVDFNLTSLPPDLTPSIPASPSPEPSSPDLTPTAVTPTPPPTPTPTPTPPLTPSSTETSPTPPPTEPLPEDLLSPTLPTPPTPPATSFAETPPAPLDPAVFRIPGQPNAT